MPSRSFRFLHASDFHLERPPYGLADVPETLRPVLADAPGQAASRVFDAALSEHVDFVVLAGDIINVVQCSPRQLVFLVAQFQRLEERKIAVYWCGGRAEAAAAWPAVLPLPANVHVFPSDRIESIVHRRDGEPLAELFGISSAQRKEIRSADFHAGQGELYSVAVAYGIVEAETLPAHEIDYWALGGEHRRRVLAVPAPAHTMAHYSGSPQGRRPGDWGAHGCTLVEVDENSRARTRLVATDVVRFVKERITVGDGTSQNQLEQLLHERARALAAGQAGPDLLVTWAVAGAVPLATKVRRGHVVGEILERLRAEHGQRRPVVWSMALDVESDSPLPAGEHGPDTILGEFLRQLHEFESRPDLSLQIESYLPRQVGDELATAVRLDDRKTRRAVLSDAARLGIDLLAGEETL